MTSGIAQECLQTGLRHHQAGRWDEAAAWYGKVRKALPENFDAAHLDGALALQQGRYDEAVASLTLGRRLNPQSAVCALRLGIARFGLRQFSEAEAVLRDAAVLDPTQPEVPFRQGQVLRRLGRLPEAAAAFERAIALRPDYAEAFEGLGTALAGWKGPLAAEPALLRATELDPKLAAAWCNLGLGWILQGRLGDALGALGRALELNPRFDHAHAGRGLALSLGYRQEAAAEAYARALALNPRNFEAHSACLLLLQHEGKLSPRELFAAHRRFGEAAEAGIRDAENLRGRSGGARRKIGFLSPDLHRHSVAYFIEPLLAHLDRERFEVVLYHDSPHHDEMSDHLRSLAAAWRHTAGLPGEALESLIRADRLDVLVDLAGHTGTNRLPLYARRLAPAQATYLGYPDTTGLRSMDYRLVDAVSDPEREADATCTERLIRFAPTAWCYRPPAEAPEPAPFPAAAGAGVTFGCFNNPAKITDAQLDDWAEILAATPDSRLLLKGKGLGAPAIQDDFVRRLDQAGIASGRATLLEQTGSVAEHLATYAQVDVALDTFPYHGTTTTCEALWMGVPVVTRRGDRHASRVGASLLQAIGRPEWIAASAEGYCDVARTLAEQALAAGPGSRAALREAMRASALLDHAAQTRRFEAALETMAKGTLP